MVRRGAGRGQCTFRQSDVRFRLCAFRLVGWLTGSRRRRIMRARRPPEEARPMNIVDSQVHLWAAPTPERPWPPGRAGDAQKPYPVDKEAMLLQMDLAGVRRVVIVPPSWEGDRNDVALEAARTYPDRFAVMGRLALGDPASRAKVADWHAFGPRRTFWGTDLTRMPCTYYECITLFTEHRPLLKGED